MLLIIFILQTDTRKIRLLHNFNKTIRSNIGIHYYKAIVPLRVCLQYVRCA